MLFPLIFILCLTLLASCGDVQPPPCDPVELAPLAAAPAETPEPDVTQPDSGAQPIDEPRAEKISMLMLGGELYLDTGLVSDEPRCGMMDGEITSSVENWERPAEDGQSNFGSGCGWQYGHDAGTVEVNIDGQWRVFQKRSEMRVRYLDSRFDAADVSDETLRWLLWFNSLDEDEQLCVSFTPLDLYELCGYPLAGDMPAEAAEGTASPPDGSSAPDNATRDDPPAPEDTHTHSEDGLCGYPLAVDMPSRDTVN